MRSSPRNGSTRPLTPRLGASFFAAAWLVCLLLGSCGNEQQEFAKHNASLLSAQLSQREAVAALIEPAAPSPHLLCSAVLIATDAALTAAHCVANPADPAGLALALGDDLQTPRALRTIRQIQLYPAFNRSIVPPPTLGSYHDLALLLLDPSDTTTAPLLPATTAQLLAIERQHQPLIVAGFGRSSTDDSTSSGIKREAPIKLAELGSNELELHPVADAQPCVGDSGGPIVAIPADPQAPAIIVGVLSRSGPDCTQGALATRLDAYGTWINEALVAASRATAALPTVSTASDTTDPAPGCHLRAASEATAQSQPWSWLTLYAILALLIKKQSDSYPKGPP